MSVICQILRSVSNNYYTPCAEELSASRAGESLSSFFFNSQAASADGESLSEDHSTNDILIITKHKAVLNSYSISVSRCLGCSVVVFG